MHATFWIFFGAAVGVKKAHFGDVSAEKVLCVVNGTVKSLKRG